MTIAGYGSKYANVHSVRCKLLADNMESVGTSFSSTSKVESGHFSSCVCLRKCVVFFQELLLRRRGKLRDVFMSVVIYRSQQQRNRRSQRIDSSQSQEVRSCLPDVVRSFFFSWLAIEDLIVSIRSSLLVESKVSLK